MNPFLDLPGAVAVDGLPVAAHYGSPLAEQRELEAGRAVVDLSHRGIVTVTGVDRLNWLHSMTSQQLTGLAPGQSVETLLLDPNGRIEQAIRLVDDGSSAWLLVDEGAAPSLVEFLNRMRFAMRVEVVDVSADYATVLAFSGAGDGAAVEKLRDLGPVAAWRDPWATVQPGGVQYARGEHPGASWSAEHFVFPRADLPSVIETAISGASAPAKPQNLPSRRSEDGVTSVSGLLALEALEVAAARPTLRGEVDERAIPHEFDWLRTAVHLTKGCYRGQETVAKVHNLGHPPRRLALLHLDGSGGELPAPGALVYPAGEAEARPVGRITRSANHHEWGGIALALLKRATPEDAALEVELGEGGSGSRLAATQQAIVPADAGKAADIPRFKRL